MKEEFNLSEKIEISKGKTHRYFKEKVLVL